MMESVNYEATLSYELNYFLRWSDVNPTVEVAICIAELKKLQVEIL